MKRMQADSYEHLTKEFSGTSDRATAIVAAVFLEQVLQELLLNFFVRDEASDSPLFKGNGTLTSFSSKISLSYRLGLISKDEHRRLHVIRNIRNEFAHELGDISFATQSVRDRCMNIRYPLEMIGPVEFIYDKNGRPQAPQITQASVENARDVFQETAIVLFHILNARNHAAVVDRRRAPPDFEQAAEIPLAVAKSFNAIADAYEEQVKTANTLRARLRALGGKPDSDDQDPQAAVADERTKARLYEHFAEMIKAGHEALAAASDKAG